MVCVTGRFSMPAASDDLMHSFYPLLANAMIQADLNSVEDEGSAAIGVCWQLWP